MKNPVPPPVIAGFSFAHHGKYSSFFRLMAELTDCEKYIFTPPFQRLLPKQLRVRWNYHWLKTSEYRLRPVFQDPTPRVLHYIYPENTLFRGPRWKGTRHKLIATLHQPHTALTGASANAWTSSLVNKLQACDAVVVLCTTEVEPIQQLTGCPRVVCIRHGIDTAYFRRSPDVAPGTPPRLLTIGNWMRDWPTWAEAVRIIQKERPDVHVDVIAEPYSHQEAIAAIGRDVPNIHYHTGLNDHQFKQFYERASLLFLPLQAATANNALLESMAMGLPVVLSDLDSLKDYTGNYAGIYFPAGDAQAAASCVLSLLDNPDEQKRQGSLLRQRAVNDLSWNVIARQYTDLYQAIRDEKNTSPPLA